MTQEEILQYNKRCAEFLGGVYDSDMTRYWFHLPVKWDGLFAPTTEELKFYSDWNWIMAVVEAIEKKAWVNIKGCAVDISTIVNLNAPTKKEAVVEAINQFLIWYEQNKQNDTN